MRKSQWRVMVGGSALTGLGVGGFALVGIMIGQAPLTEDATGVVAAVFAASWCLVFVVPGMMWSYFRSYPIEEERSMAWIESAKGTVKFDDECWEYDFIHSVRQHPQAQAKIYESIAAWKSADLIAADIHSELWITTLDAIPEPGIHRDLFGRYLQSLDWDEIATYYIEQYEQEHASGKA